MSDEITFEEHRWHVIIRRNGEFLRAFASDWEFSGLGTFDTEEEFNNWRNEL